MVHTFDSLLYLLTFLEVTYFLKRIYILIILKYNNINKCTTFETIFGL
jgi:energy-converting hydrogenase Eha subunit E